MSECFLISMAAPLFCLMSLVPRVEIWMSRRLKRRRDIEISTRGTRIISENVGAAMEMAQMKQLEGMEVTRVFLHSNCRSEIVFLT